jgi:hypothetical protein
MSRKAESSPKVESYSGDSFPFVPGGMSVKHVPRRSTEYYCKTCLAFIMPMWIRKQGATFPACRECFYNDLAVIQIGEPDVATTEVAAQTDGAA